MRILTVGINATNPAHLELEEDFALVQMKASVGINVYLSQNPEATFPIGDGVSSDYLAAVYGGFGDGTFSVPITLARGSIFLYADGVPSWCLLYLA